MSEKDLLAIYGGAKAVPELKARFHFGQEEKDAVVQLFDKAIVSGEPFGYGGEEELAFCREFSDFLGGGYADGVNSGTNAIFTALYALGLKPFSEVIVSSITDPGGMMPVVLNNCIPAVADAAPGRFNTGPEQVEARITSQTSAILVSHIAGEPADIKGILEVADRHGIPVVEDCAQAYGAEVDGQLVGTFGAYGAFSLMFGKHICTGGQGGIVFTRSEELYRKQLRAADRGKPFYMDAGNGNVIPALNCNMDELRAVIGRAQLKKLPGIIARRRHFVELLKQQGLEDLKIISLPEQLPGAVSSYWWLRLKFNADQCSCSRKEFFTAMEAEGVSIVSRYQRAMPSAFAWFQERAGRHPWNNPLCQGDPCRDFPLPNTMRSLDENFICFIHESWGEEEAAMLLHAFRKLDAAFAG